MLMVQQQGLEHVHLNVKILTFSGEMMIKMPHAPLLSNNMIDFVLNYLHHENRFKIEY